MEKSKKEATIYCHFSFKRPNRGADGVGLFSVAFYRDFEGKRLITYSVTESPLWENHQFITAIQSFEYALSKISEFQGAMMHGNIRQVMLVTDNSTLAGWIENPRKNKEYTKLMMRAFEQFRDGGPREIVIGVGLCEPRQYEKSYKYCSRRYINDTGNKTEVKIENGVKKHVINTSGMELKSVGEVLKEYDIAPKIEGIREL